MWNSSIHARALARKNSRTGPEPGPSKLMAWPQSVWCRVGEVVRGELAEIVAVGAEVVVDDVEDDGEAVAMRLVHEAAQVVGLAVDMRGGEEVDAVIAPAEAAGELGDRHHLDARDPEIGEVAELASSPPPTFPPA